MKFIAFVSLVISLIVGGIVEGILFKDINNYAQQVFPDNGLFRVFLHFLVVVVSAGGTFGILTVLSGQKGNSSGQ
jgi:hypothetical protein